MAPFAVLAIDVDNCKQINDSYGHDAGNMVLRHLAVVLSDSCQAGGYFFRLGREEFFILLMRRADDALYQAMSYGRNRVVQATNENVAVSA